MYAYMYNYIVMLFFVDRPSIHGIHHSRIGFTKSSRRLARGVSLTSYTICCIELQKTERASFMKLSWLLLKKKEAQRLSRRGQPLKEATGDNFLRTTSWCPHIMVVPVPS